jgi:AraC-like DNA-binding protein
LGKIKEMKPQLLKVEPGPALSFSIRRDVVPHNNNLWHYHSELELIYFKEGSGIQFVGDSIQRFQKGDVVLLGANLPHYWRFDSQYFHNKGVRPDVGVIHFREDFWGNTFLDLPENRGIKLLFEKAKSGMQLKGNAKKQVAKKLNRLLKTEASTERIILLLKTLSFISATSDYALISTKDYLFTLKDKEKDRIKTIYNFVLSNFNKKISLHEVAELAGVSPNSFCRYFKSKTNKTFSRFLIEIRIGHACKLLVDSEMSVKELCFESGFNNFASFHKYFKEITSKSPLAYRREYLNEGL